MKKLLISLTIFALLVAPQFAFAVKPDNPSAPVTVVNEASDPVPVTGNVGITGTPNINISNTVPVAVERELVNDGTFFDLVAYESITLTVPSGVVLTDAHVSFAHYYEGANASLFAVQDAPGTIGAKKYVWQSVNDMTFDAGIDLNSGIMSDGSLQVYLGCNNIEGNKCRGAIMWSGYKP